MDIRICITESLCCNLKLIQHCKSTMLQYRIKTKLNLKKKHDRDHCELFWTSVILKNCLEVLRIKAENVDRNVVNANNEKSFCVFSIYNIQLSIFKLLNSNIWHDTIIQIKFRLSNVNGQEGIMLRENIL